MSDSTDKECMCYIHDCMSLIMCNNYITCIIIIITVQVN